MTAFSPGRVAAPGQDSEAKRPRGRGSVRHDRQYKVPAVAGGAVDRRSRTAEEAAEAASMPEQTGLPAEARCLHETAHLRAVRYGGQPSQDTRAKVGGRREARTRDLRVANGAGTKRKPLTLTTVVRRPDVSGGSVHGHKAPHIIAQFCIVLRTRWSQKRSHCRDYVKPADAWAIGLIARSSDAHRRFWWTLRSERRHLNRCRHLDSSVSPSPLAAGCSSARFWGGVSQDCQGPRLHTHSAAICVVRPEDRETSSPYPLWKATALAGNTLTLNPHESIKAWLAKARRLLLVERAGRRCCGMLAPLRHRAARDTHIEWFVRVHISRGRRLVDCCRAVTS